MALPGFLTDDYRTTADDWIGNTFFRDEYQQHIGSLDNALQQGNDVLGPATGKPKNPRDNFGVPIPGRGNLSDVPWENDAVQTLSDKIDELIEGYRTGLHDAVTNAVGTISGRSKNLAANFNKEIRELEGRVQGNLITERDVDRSITNAEDRIQRDLQGDLGEKAASLSRSGVQGGAITGTAAAELLAKRGQEKIDTAQDIREFQKSFNAAVISDADKIKASLVTSREQLLNNLATARSIMERGDLLDPEISMSNLWNLANMDQGITQAEETLRLARDNLENLTPDALESVLDLAGNWLTLGSKEKWGMFTSSIPGIIDSIV